ncbi:MAG TPA: DUF3570 domain-containing protein [Burkholderiaceae bacterium]|nr:DUF3570 domain-containing protein [Burkholderiaceae bacterium]
MHNKTNTPARSVIAAALALPGLLPSSAHSQVTAPNATLVQFKFLYYKDYQQSGDRMTVKSPALYLLTPITDDWVFEIGAVYDSISGASPYYHTTLSGASGKGIHDARKAADVTVTKYFANRTSVAVRGAYSDENDYRSTAGSVTIRHATPDQNTTFTIGGGYSGDSVFPTVGTPQTYYKRTYDAIVGISQVFTPNDTGQLNYYYAHQSGYLTDPYKAYWGVDNRPMVRAQNALLARWNHYFESADATLRTSFRYYWDDWDVSASTVTLEWAQTLPAGWVLTPGLRYSTQSAAWFYYDPVYDPILGAPFPPGYLQNPNGIYSADQRLSAFGAITAGLKVSKAFAGGWIIDGKAEYYEQQASWRIGGDGSPGLETFKAQMYQVGVTRKF